MHDHGCPPRRRLSPLIPLVLCASLVAGCSDEEAIRRATTITLATATPDAQTTRDKDVAWIYHLAKTHATDDLVSRLDHERQRIDDDRAAKNGSQPQNILASEPPRSAPPIASLATGPADLATAAATPRADDPLAALPSEGLDPAIVLALYHIDPATYKTLFVDNYPTTADGVQHDYGDRLTRANLTPDGEAYPIVALARYAATDEIAAAKLYTAASVANGEVADRYATTIAAFTKGHPAALLPMLTRLEMSTRLATVSEPAGWCHIRPGGTMNDAPDDPAQLAIQRDLRTTLSACASYLRGLRTPDRRHAAHHVKRGRKLAKGKPKAHAAKKASG